MLSSWMKCYHLECHVIILSYTEPEFLEFYEAQESIPPAYEACRAGTTTLFLLGS